MSFKLAFQAFFFGIVFTLVAIVVIFFKVLEKVEKKYAIRRAAYELRRLMRLMLSRRVALRDLIFFRLEEENQKFLNDVKRRKEGLSVSGIRNDDANPKEGYDASQPGSSDVISFREVNVYGIPLNVRTPMMNTMLTDC